MKRICVLAELVLVMLQFPLMVAAKEKVSAELARWEGDWAAGAEQDMGIRIEGDRLQVSGFASWGASDPKRVEIGAIHVGEFSAAVPVDWIEGDRLAFAIGRDGAAVRPEAADDFDCVITLLLMDGSLEAKDNMMCGGLNVTFDGVYNRAE